MTSPADAAPNKALRRALLLGLAACVGALLFAMLLSPARREPPIPPLPNPNGYDDFLKAASLLSDDVYKAAKLTRDDLRALITTNAQALTLVRLGLSRACSIHTDSAITNHSGMISEFIGLRRINVLLTEEGRLAELENRKTDAARSYLDAIRFGNEFSRGGFLVHRSMGIASETAGCELLTRLAPKLTCQESRSIIGQLEKADYTSVAWEEVLSNEHRHYEYVVSHTRGFNPIDWIYGNWLGWQTQRRLLKRHKNVAAHLRLLATELALRCYRSSKGRPPARLEDLVPDCLAKVPQDPFSHRALIYRPKGADWLLYSVGPDGVDDGGRPIISLDSKGDIFFDSP